MATELDNLAIYYQEKGNNPRANLYAALAAEERAIGGPDTLAPKPVTSSLGEAVVTPPVISIPETIYLPRPEELVEAGARAWNSKEIPTPPDQLFDVLARAQQEGFRTFIPRYYAPVEYNKRSKFPGEGKKLEDWFWTQIGNGNIDKDAATLKGGWVLLDSSRKLIYGEEYEAGGNRLGLILQELRKSGNIKVPDWCKDIPAYSRFGVSWDEIDTHVAPEVANILGVDRAQVGVPREIEFNVAGNVFHPEWGKTNTWEWMADRFGHGSRLIGGHSDLGGLSHVRDHSSGDHYDSLGFRLQIAFPSNS